MDDDIRFVTVTQLRSDAGAILEGLDDDRPVTVTRRGEPVAVLLSSERHRQLLRERELLRRLALGELESAVGEGEPLAEVIADADLLLEVH